ncbi:MAG TPA: dTDP-4-dehydrorhamnose 3,5-epimerase [Thermoanaerobaculia bacterium]|jgi:dTDP-4-dehydrorhamnose 3,5-epimerase
MKFDSTPLPGAFVITPERLEDERGWFARTFSRSDFERRGLNPDVVQCNLSLSARRGTLRGMHFQRPPHAEAKLVRCARGAIYDVIVDLRPSSPAYRRHFGIRLDPSDDRMLFVPEGCAHGFLTLEEDTLVFYQMSQGYEPSAAAGVRWNDPAFGIAWPFAPTVMAERDRSYPDFRE